MHYSNKVLWIEAGLVFVLYTLNSEIITSFADRGLHWKQAYNMLGLYMPLFLIVPVFNRYI